MTQPRSRDWSGCWAPGCDRWDLLAGKQLHLAQQNELHLWRGHVAWPSSSCIVPVSSSAWWVHRRWRSCRWRNPPENSGGTPKYTFFIFFYCILSFPLNKPTSLTVEYQTLQFDHALNHVFPETISRWGQNHSVETIKQQSVGHQQDYIIPGVHFLRSIHVLLNQ